MKKIISMLAIAAVGGLLLSACDDDDTTNDITVNGLTVTSAQTTFAAAGGTHDITVAKTPISAYSNDNWATVAISGNTVSVTAAQNNDIQTRHASIVIKSSQVDSAVVNIDQDGMVVSLSTINPVISDAAATHSYYINHNLPVTVSTSVDWLSATISGDSLALSAAENTTGLPRQGWVYYTSGILTDSVQILQFSPEKDVAGDYYLYYYSNRNWYYVGVNIGQQRDGSYAMTFTDDDLAGFGWKVPVTLNSETPDFTFNNLSNMGTYTDSLTYSVLWMVMADDGSNIYTSRDSTVTATASWAVDDDGASYWSVTQNGFDSSYEFYAFQLGLSTDGSTYDRSAGSILRLPYAQFEKATGNDDDSSSAKRSHSAKRGNVSTLLSKGIVGKKANHVPLGFKLRH